MHPPRGEIALRCAAFLEFVLIVFTIIIIPRFLLGWEGVTPFVVGSPVFEIPNFSFQDYDLGFL